MDNDDPVSGTAPGPNTAARSGIGLCLSGGGYRAMLFHTGSLLRRLHELGFLSQLSRTGIANRLAKMPALDQERLINWGYAVCDDAVCRHVDPKLPAATAFAYSAAGVGA